MHQQRLTGGNASQHATSAVAEKPGGRQFIAMFAATLRHRSDTGADFNRFDRIDAHHGMGDVGIEPIKNRFAQSRWQALCTHCDARAHRITGAAQFPQQFFKLWDSRRIGTEERILVGSCRLQRLNPQRANLTDVAKDAYLEAFRQILSGDGAGRDAHHGLACRRTATAAMVAMPVFLCVGVVGVPGTKAIRELVVIARTRVGVLDQHTNRRTGGAALEDPRQDPHLIAFAALTDEMRSARAPPIDVALQI